MIRLIEALNFRCLRYIRQPLGPFHILVGPNASGKTTFLDVIAFLGQMVSDGLEKAVQERTANFQDLVWGRKGDWFELAIEASIPDDRKQNLKKDWDTIRYEVRIGKDIESDMVSILEERLSLKKARSKSTQLKLQFPEEYDTPQTIFAKNAKGDRTIISKKVNGNSNYYLEVQETAGKGWFPSMQFSPQKSALENLSPDESKFPVSTWFKRLLTHSVQNFILNSQVIRKASPPLLGKGFRPDGSNLPWAIKELRSKSSKRFAEWIDHLRTTLTDIEDIQVKDREDDKHCYLMVCYRGGLEVPSWMTSDGTLRLLALTLPAYLNDFRGIYLIEEPENGIHPGAVDTLYQSLSSVYDAQIFLATHSPVLLSLAKTENVLCFKKAQSGATDIVEGNKHPGLRNWKGTPNLSVLFASGVLG
jgi:predicted ATPase